MTDEHDKKVIESVNRIRKKFKTETDGNKEEKAQLNFLDELNALIRYIFKDNSTDVYTALSPEALERWKKQKWKRWFSRLFHGINPYKISLFLLLATITGFLVSEALGFYAIDDVFTTKTYVKAILTEVCFIFLSGYRSSGKLATVFVSALRVSIFALMLFVITSQVLFSGAQTESDISNIAQQIEFIQEQIVEKDKLIKFYSDKNWGVNVRLQSEEKAKLVAKLLELKERQIKEKKSENTKDLVRYKTYGRAAFRVIILLISVLITRRLFVF